MTKWSVSGMWRGFAPRGLAEKKKTALQKPFMREKKNFFLPCFLLKKMLDCEGYPIGGTSEWSELVEGEG